MKFAVLMSVFLLACVLIQAIQGTEVKGEGRTDLQVKYFQPAVLTCRFPDTDTSETGTVYFWILPSGDILKPTDDEEGNASTMHVTLNEQGVVLNIDKVDDPDFGFYFCIRSVDSYSDEVGVVKVGLNVDGPYYGDELADTLKNNVIVGAISASVALVVLVGIWIWCAQCLPNPKPSQANQGTINETCVTDCGKANGDVMVQVDANDEEDMTKLDDDVYYMADGVDSMVVKRPKYPNEVKQEQHQDVPSDRLSSSDSGHYHSIGSLGRDASLLTEEDFGKLGDKHAQTSEIDPNERKSLTALKETTQEVRQTDTTDAIDNVFDQDDDPSELYAKPMKPKRQNIRKDTAYETVVLPEDKGEMKEKMNAAAADNYITIEVNSKRIRVVDEPNEQKQSGKVIVAEDELNIDENKYMEEKDVPTDPATRTKTDKSEPKGENTSSNEVNEQTFANFNNVLSSMAGLKFQKSSENDEIDSGDESSKSVIDIRL